MYSISRSLTILRAPASSRLRMLHTTPRALASSKDAHTADHYSKDVDVNPPPDQTIHRVDGHELAEHAKDHYATTDKGYAPPGEKNNDHEEEKGSYGAVTDVKSRRARGSAGKSGEGPTKGDAGGRK
ncbi:hypothetical protein FIBSPDRAFT_939989 [Athelia psychrophila]|uniref:Uncharacterized protein n=1 Tax=Athelia psychrophila TaxID=1759441 RepID=A0A167WUM7_9AGAM|nr:hypothetical protein FIBSPDRAFT_939989 [Fibularhizoctonia sp. CBS 109695]